MVIPEIIRPVLETTTKTGEWFKRNKRITALAGASLLLSIPTITEMVNRWDINSILFNLLFYEVDEGESVKKGNGIYSIIVSGKGVGRIPIPRGKVIDQTVILISQETGCDRYSLIINTNEDWGSTTIISANCE